MITVMVLRSRMFVMKRTGAMAKVAQTCPSLHPRAISVGIFQRLAKLLNVNSHPNALRQVLVFRLSQNFSSSEGETLACYRNGCPLTRDRLPNSSATSDYLHVTIVSCRQAIFSLAVSRFLERIGQMEAVVLSECLVYPYIAPEWYL